MAFVLYKHLGTYLSTENASMKFSSEALSTNYTVIVNSPIITAAINKDSNKVYLSDPVVFTVRHIQVRKHLCFIPIHRFISYDCRSIERRARNWSVWPVSLMEGMKYLLWVTLSSSNACELQKKVDSTVLNVFSIWCSMSSSLRRFCARQLPWLSWLGVEIGQWPNWELNSGYRLYSQ